MQSGEPTRRDIIRAAIAAATLSAGATATRATPERAAARGVVRVKEAEESHGLAGVLVTNGRDVVATDANGAYALPIDGDAIISVIKPTGYAVPVAARTNLPRFHYVYQPKGSPAELGLTAPGVAPTGPLPASIDFTLRASPEPSRFEAVLFADPQPETNAEVDFIRDGVAPELAGTKAAFGLTLGDITGDDLSLYPRIASIIGQIGIPWYNAIGNHDLNYEAPDDRHARETFKSTFGPTHYAFEHGGALFIVLDNIAYHGADATQPGKQGNYHDSIPDDQLRFVENLLRHVPSDRLIVLAMHIPLRSRRDESGREIAVDDCAELLRLIGDRPCVSFSGHTHMAEHKYIWPTIDATPEQAHHHQVLATVCGSWWSGPNDRAGVAIADCCDGSPAGYYILEIDGPRATTRFQPTRDPRERRLRAVLAARAADCPANEALLGGALSTRQCAGTDVVVNVFDGGPRTSVQFRVGDRPAVNMRRVAGIDPFVAAVYARNAAAIKPWVQAEISSHVWRAPLPVDLAPGAHRIEATAVDEFGRTIGDVIVLEIAGEEAAVRG